MEKLWTTAEVARYLSISEADVEQLVRQGKLTGYKLGGRFLRFRPDQVKALKAFVEPTSQAASLAPEPTGRRDRLREFLYFYDFYLFAVLLLAGVACYLIISG